VQDQLSPIAWEPALTFFNQALLDQRSGVYQGTMLPKIAEMCNYSVWCGNVWTGGTGQFTKDKAVANTQ